MVAHRLRELRILEAAFAVELDADETGRGVADVLGRDVRHLGDDHTLVAHALQPALDRGGGEPDALADLLCRDARVGLIGSEDLEIEWIELGHRVSHERQPARAPS